jgi:acetyl-CoA C-acetyltransferase
MTNAPYLLTKARSGYRLGHGQLVDSMIHDGLWDIYSDKHMAHCGDLCASKYDISREAQDDYAIESFNRAIRAWDEGFHGGGAIPVEVKSRKGTVLLERDEDVSKFQGPEKLRSLPSAFGPTSLVTAGNASGINDGAAAMLVFGDLAKDSKGLKPMAKIIGYATASTEPDWFTVAPVMVIRKLCERLKVSPGDVDIFEVNEAFALVPVLAQRELKLDPDRVNVVGGAVSIGHPIGATGTRIVGTLARLLQQRELRLGIASICLGGGEATAIALERYE